MALTILIGVQLGEHYYKVGTEVVFLIDGEIDEESNGVITELKYSGRWEEDQRHDFIIQWDDCTSPSRTPQTMMVEQVRPKKC